MKNTSRKTQKLTGLSILSAIIIVLQIFCTFVKFGPVSITLALAPIIIGAAIYGATAGAVLGFVFSLVVLLTGVLGWDGGFVMYLMSLSPIGLLMTVVFKGMVAGWISGLVYRVIEKKGGRSAAPIAGILCPVLNTSLFLAGMFTFFVPALESMAADKGMNMVAFVLVGLCGVNFIIELIVNVALSSVITRVVKLRKKSGRSF